MKWSVNFVCISGTSYFGMWQVVLGEHSLAIIDHESERGFQHGSLVTPFKQFL
jgi:hypothetical protein